MHEILLIEDDDDIRITTLELLEMEGLSAVARPQGQAALDYLNESGTVLPKLILVDLAMPVLNGVAFREAQLASPKLKSIPCVVMSADGQIDLKCRSLGIDYCIKKPVEIDEFLALVRKFVMPKAGA